MSRFTSRFSRVLLAIAGVGLGTLILNFGQSLIIRDPLAGFRKHGKDDQIGVRLENVELKHYKGSKLLGSCQIERVDIHKNRDLLDLYGVSRGRYAAQKGEFNFEAKLAAYDSNASILTVPPGARVWNKDLDLVAPAFTYTQGTSSLVAQGSIRGKLYDGTIQAQNLTYNVADDSYRIGPAIWEGTSASPLQEATGEKQFRAWKFKTSGGTRSSNGIQTWDDAEATDGDVIIKAPKIMRDTKTDVITATGKVLYYSAKANLVCDKAVVFRKEKRAVLSGVVDMLVKAQDQERLEVVEIPPFRPMVPDEVSKDRPPAPPVSEQDKNLDQEVRSNETRRKYPVAIRAGKIEYWYKKGNRHAIITGSPQARQDLSGPRWRAVWGVTAYYDGEKELLKLVSSQGRKDTRVKTSLGDDIVCSWFEVSTQENNDDWSGFGMEGTLYPDDEEIPKTSGDRATGKKPPPMKGRIGT